MIVAHEDIFEWKESDMVEIFLKKEDDFLKIKETLTRIGIASKKEKILYPSCYIFHKKGRYYLMNFKEILALNGKETNISYTDIERRNTITALLVEWNMITILDESKIQFKAPLSLIKIIPFKEKSNWKIVHKYTLGTERRSIKRI